MKRPEPESALGYALLVIEAYATEIRNRPALLSQGFCQGELFRTAEETVLRKRERERAGGVVFFNHADGLFHSKKLRDELRAFNRETVFVIGRGDDPGDPIGPRVVFRTRQAIPPSKREDVLKRLFRAVQWDGLRDTVRFSVLGFTFDVSHVSEER